MPSDKKTIWQRIKGPLGFLTMFGLMLFIPKFLEQRTDKSGAQTAYIPGTTLAMDQTPCVAATSGAPLPFEANGTTVTCGPWPGDVVGIPTSRTMSLGTAIQATDPTKAAIVTITISSTATFSLVGGTTNTGVVVMGSASSIGTSGGFSMGNYSNSITGTIAVGLNMNSVMTNTYTVFLPAGYWAAVRQTGGTISIVSSFDQSI